MPAQPFRPDVPFNSLPLLPPAAELETRTVLKGCIPARAALAELNAAAHLIPNPAILINTIPVLEARASSEIENIVTTTDRLFRLAADDSAQADPATKEALRYAHYQFEAIHPFEDGNGRTGRILNLLFLVEQRLLDSPVLYLSRAIIRTKPDYYRLLLEVTTRDAWEPWLLYMIEAIDETARWTTAKIAAIRSLLRAAGEFVRARAPRAYSRELMDVIFEQPYCRIANVVEAGIAKRQTASEYLGRLADIGVLTPVQSGRDKLFIHRALLDLLTSETHEVARYG